MSAELTPNQLKWVEALESGEFAQTRGVLHRFRPDGRGDPVGFCCLGVACELALRDGVKLDVYEADHGIVIYDENEGVLPARVQEWLGYTGRFGGDPLIGDSRASQLNDQHWLTFTSIAAEIRKHGVR